MASWPAFVLERMEPISSWEVNKQKLIDNPELVYQTVREQAEKLKVENLPTTTLE